MSSEYQQITVETVTQQRYLLSPVISPARPEIVQLYGSPSEVPSHALRQLSEAAYVALDFETRGNDFSHPDFTAVGVGLSTDTISFYVDLSQSNWDTIQEFLLRLGQLPLIGHNILFDGGCFYRHTGFHANWQYCTYGLFKQLSSESNELQWGLKGAQKELLGWAETNEVELDNWLVSNGYAKGNKKADKGQMWRAPASILGHYCALDAQSTHMLFTKVLQPALSKFEPILTQYHQRDFITEIEFLIEQQITGITIDKERLQAHEKVLVSTLYSHDSAFRSHPLISPAIAQYNLSIVEDIRSNEPPQYLKRPTLGTEPARTTKAGKQSANWEKWEAKRIAIEGWECPANESAHWKAWAGKLNYAQSVDHFNLQSGPQLRWLFYDYLKHPVRVETDSGLPAVDEDALKSFGEPGRILIEYMTAQKELGYTQAYLEALRVDSEGIWRGHPQFRIPGTLTGRLAGTGGVNYQQLPKSGPLLSAFRPMLSDRTWVDFDIVGAEAVVATELSRCPAMLAIYGPGAKKNDVYLYFASNLPGEMGKRVRDTGYDPLNPTPETVAIAKKECKNIRNIAKTCIAENTEVLTKRGWKQIQNVLRVDYVWDGIQWVGHHGLLDNGMAQVVELSGVKMTADHKVMSTVGWKYAEEFRTIQEGADSPQLHRPNVPSASWSDVWRLGSAVICGTARKWLSLCFGKMSNLQCTGRKALR